MSNFLKIFTIALAILLVVITAIFMALNMPFINAVESGAPCRNDINSVLETMKLLDALYASSDKKQEINF